MWIALLGSLLAAGVVIVCLLGTIRLISRTVWLRRNGTRIIATVTETHMFSLGSPPGRFYLKATWTDPPTGETYVYRTTEMRSLQIYKAGDPVEVIIDPLNPRRYYIPAVSNAIRDQ